MAKFPEPMEIELEAEKKEFVHLFGELLKSENILRNFDKLQNFIAKIRWWCYIYFTGFGTRRIVVLRERTDNKDVEE